MRPFRVAVVADTHADEASRFDEHERVMSWIANDIAEREVDLVVHGGDAFERERSSAIERRAVADWCRAVTERAPLVVVRGNHDGDIDIDMLGRLRTKHPVHAFSRPGVVRLGPLAVAAMPWPRSAQLLAALGRDVSHADSGRIAQECLRNVLRGLGAEMRATGLRRLLVGHFMIDGANTDHDQPVVGGDMAVSVADIALAEAEFVAAGHIHAATNEWETDHGPVAYPGAPMHRNFGEPGPGKGYIIVDYEPGEVRWLRITSPARRMILAEGAWDGALVPPDSLRHVDGAEVRFRYRVANDQRDLAKAAAAALKADIEARGAVLVKIEEEVEAFVRARAPEIAKAKTLEDKLGALWASRGIELDELRRPRVIDRLHRVEREERAA